MQEGESVKKRASQDKYINPCLNAARCIRTERYRYLLRSLPRIRIYLARPPFSTRTDRNIPSFEPIQPLEYSWELGPTTPPRSIFDVPFDVSEWKRQKTV